MKKEIWIPKTEVFAEMFGNSKQVHIKSEMEFELKKLEEKKVGFHNEKKY